MENLTKYGEQFEDSFRAFGDARYNRIIESLCEYAQRDLEETLSSKQFADLCRLVKPIIEIKNYKSQTPFPVDLETTIRVIAGVKRWDPAQDENLSQLDDHLKGLITLDGIRLPTASAVLHFCHPEHFPIVDVNVEAACRRLKESCPEEFSKLDLPKLPATTDKRAETSVTSYRQFIRFLCAVLQKQRRYSRGANFRSLDKALMVLGSQELKKRKKEGLASAGDSSRQASTRRGKGQKSPVNSRRDAARPRKRRKDELGAPAD